MLSRILLYCLLLLTTAFAHAQSNPGSVVLQTLPSEGVLLDQGWKFHPGDNAAWANPDFDDSAWQPINPSINIRQVAPLLDSGLGWFRLHMKIDTNLLHKPLNLLITQSGASQIYLDGKLIYSLGTVSNNPVEEVIYNPNKLPLPVNFNGNSEVMLAVRYSFSERNFRFLFSDWQGNSCFSVRLQGAADSVKDLVYERSYISFREFAKVGYFLLLGLLHLFFFASFPSRRTNLYCSIAAFSFALVYFLYYTYHFLPQQGVSALAWSSVTNLLEGQAGFWLLYSTYSITGERIGLRFWLAFILLLVAVRYGGIFLPVGVLFFSLDAIWVSWRGIKKGIPDARLSLISWVGYAVLASVFYLFFFQLLPLMPLIMDLIYNGLLVWITSSFFLLLAREYARTNRSLSQKLLEIQELSAKTLTQQQEKQQLLATENERLEKQVRERTEEIAQQAERLQEQDQLKSRFITNLTHEFRTPLSLILSPVEKLLRDASAPAQYRALLSVIERNARQLLSLVNQLLDLSKIDAGHMSITEQVVQPVRLVEDVLELFRPQMESKGIELQWLAEGGRENYLLDSDKWNKILMNLLSNAVKFTPEGGTISVRLQVIDKKAFIEIADTGKGIAPEKLPYIFDRFYQIDDSTTRAHEGTGIGLALVKELIQLLEGNIEVESNSGKGTTCRLSLPLSYIEPVAIQSTDITTEANYVFSGVEIHTPLPSAEDKPLVLVVEDNVDLRTFLAEELSASYRVLTATNGIEGWDLVRHELPDIVVSDVMMPGLDGFSLTGLIKSNPITNHIAVVLLTARTAQESRLEGLIQGADDYLSKPFNSEELQLRLRNLLLRREKLQAYIRKGLLLSGEQSESAPPLDSFLTRIYELLEAKLDDSTFGVEALAQEVGMSRRTLHRKVSALTNLSVQELIRQYRLKKATHLLRSGHNVSETAYLVGYESPAHFTATFKAFYHQTPSEFLSQ